MAWQRADGYYFRTGDKATVRRSRRGSGWTAHYPPQTPGAVGIAIKGLDNRVVRYPSALKAKQAMDAALCARMPPGRKRAAEAATYTDHATL